MCHVSSRPPPPSDLRGTQQSSGGPLCASVMSCTVDHVQKPGSINSYRLCMEAFRRSGDAAGALSVLARMRAEGWQPDVVRVCSYYT